MRKGGKSLDQIERKRIEKAIAGDTQAFESIILAYEHNIYKIALKVVKQEELAYDVAQEICIKIYKKLHTYQFESALSTWIYRIATNTAIDEYRKLKRTNAKEFSFDQPITDGEDAISFEIPDEQPLPLEQVLQKEKKRYVWEALDQLKDEQREIILLKDIENKSYQEISELLDIQIGTVKSRLARSRIALKELLKNLWEQNLI